MFVVIILLLFKVPYSAYNNGAKYITYFLVPVTVCFAVPMYKQLPLLKKHGPAILTAILIGVVCSVFSVGLICILFGLGDVVAKSLAAISVTTAIAIGITEKLGGVVALTVSSVIVTGILGASVSDVVVAGCVYAILLRAAWQLETHHMRPAQPRQWQWAQLKAQ